jgi:type IV secretion system protein VirB4
MSRALALPSLRLVGRHEEQGIHLPFARRIAPGVVVTRSGDLLATWSLAGMPFEGLSGTQLEASVEGLNLLVRSLANGHFAFWVHRVRSSSADRLSSPSSPFGAQLMQKYYARMAAGGLVKTELFLTLIYRPHPQPSGRIAGRMGRTAEEIAARRRVALELLGNACRQTEASLKDYGPTRLSESTDEGIRFSRQLEFYDFLVNGEWGKVAVKEVPLWAYLPRTRKLFGNELLEIRSAKGSRFGSFLDLQDYAETTYPGILNTLFRLGGEYIETHSFSPLVRLDAAASLKRRIRQLASTDDDSPTQRADMLQALDDLASGRFALGSYHYSLLILGDSESQVKAHRAEAVDLLQKTGFRAAVVDVVPDAAYWAQLPGNWQYRPRIAELSSRNFAGLASLHNFDPGKRDGNPWGEAISILRSPSGQPLFFNCHATRPGRNALGEKALGATQIIGQSGEGKTVLAGFIAANLTKYGIDLVWFDKDRGAEILIRALGGRYLTLERGIPTGFAPFKREPSEQAILHWIDLVRMCAQTPGRAFTTREELEIDQAVRAVAALPTDVRGFEAVLQNLPKSREDAIHARLGRWSKARGGSLSWALDGDADLVQLGHGVPHGFDYTELLEDPSVHPQIMMHLIYRTEEIIDGRRFAFFMEEYWKALENPYFEDFAKNKQKTIRKQNGFGVYLTQSPSDTLANPIAKTLIEQTATFIFLPNPAADFDDYVGGFKLKESEFEIVKTLPRGSHLMLIKQGTQVSIGRLDLEGFSEELMVLSGSSDNVARLDRLRARIGDDPSVWLPPFLRGES